jgi:hypothetical protein
MGDTEPGPLEAEEYLPTVEEMLIEVSEAHASSPRRQYELF